MWEVANNRQVIFGENKILQIPSLLKWYKCKNAFLVVPSKNIRGLDSLLAELSKEDIGYYIYDAIQGEPDLHIINEGRDIFVNSKCDCTIAIGGGSVIDAAKAINMLSANGGLVEQYQMEGKQVTNTSPLYIAVPTTSGTGAEATKTSVVTNNYNGLKKSLYHNSMIADITILDPNLVIELPVSVISSTGMDALSHAIESYVSLNAHPLSEMYGLKTIELINENFVTSYKQPDNMKARGNMMIASFLGGSAITAGIGIAHIMAQPLGAMFHIPHGDACSIFLPLAMEANLEYAAKKYAKIAEVLGVADLSKSDTENAKAAIEKVKEISSLVNAPNSIKPYTEGIQFTIDDVIDTVLKTTGHINCNPKPLTKELIVEMFERAMI